MNGGQIIAKVLQQYGVKHLFTLCGGHISPIYVEAEKEGIQIVDVRNEAAAVFAADALARLSGIPGVAAVTAGPGVTNSLTALKNAQMAQSPLLLLGGATATLLRGRGALQDIDQLSIIKSSVKWSGRAKRTSELAPLLHLALQRSMTGVPGPVFLECPVDLLYNESTVREWYGQKNKVPKSIQGKIRHWYINRHVNRLFKGFETSEIERQFSSEAILPAISSRDINFVLQQLRMAKQPVMVIGSGAMQLPNLSNQLSEAVQGLGVPVYLSGMARGLTGAQSAVHYRHKRTKALREADCILLAGVPCDFRLDYGQQLNRQAKKITINRSTYELKKNILATKTCQVDPGQFLIELTKAATDLPSWENWKEELNGREMAREKQIDDMAKEKIEGINPLALFRQLEKLLPENSVIIVDGGDFAASASYTLKPRKPLAWLDPGVFGTLGVGGGFALGAALHYPSNYIWIIYGDGSAAYSLTEFDTFKKMGLKVCAIIGNNGSWEQIARDQITLLGTKTATELPQSNYQGIAQAFGANGERVKNVEDFSEAVKRAIASMDNDIPYVINAIIGPTDFRKGSLSM